MCDARAVNGKRSNSSGPKGVLLVHDMRVHETFEQCSHRLFTIVRDAVRRFPTKPRFLHLMVQGHRNSVGGFDDDAFEIMSEFLLGTLMPFLTEASTPLLHVRNPNGQSNDIPDELIIGDTDIASRSRPRDHDPEVRRSKPTLRAITTYLGLDEPICMICWATPVERAHAKPVALGGSNDVRNFALLCDRHHRMAPDVSDSNAFWQWVDWRLSLDHPLSNLGRASPFVAEREEFFAQVRAEVTGLYGHDLSKIDGAEWLQLLEIYYRVLETDTSSHFKVARKVSTHAYALHLALRELDGRQSVKAGPAAPLRR